MSSPTPAQTPVASSKPSKPITDESLSELVEAGQFARVQEWVAAHSLPELVDAIDRMDKVLAVAAFRQTGARRLAAKSVRDEEKRDPGGSASDWARWFSDPRNRIG